MNITVVEKSNKKKTIQPKVMYKLKFDIFKISSFKLKIYTY